MRKNGKRGSTLTNNQIAIEVESLIKKYGTLTAVDSISFSVKKGEIFAFLGPNGAGKTTTVEILECIRKPTSGKAFVLGFDILKDEEKIKKRIGVLPQDFNTFSRLTVKENIEYFAGMFGSSIDANDLIKLVDLEDKRNEQYKNLSGGLKQRLGVAIALVNDPEILFLDEPTAGLDPKARHEVWDMVQGLKQKGKTIFLTTHYMEEAEILADTVTIIHKGKIVADGTTQELIERHGKLSLLILKKIDKAAVPLIETLGLTAEYDKETRDVKVILNHTHAMSEIIRALSIKQIGFEELQLKKSTLEDVFLNLTGEKLRKEDAS
jgi:ABC-2 type transport system ATP-binding protein